MNVLVNHCWCYDSCWGGMYHCRVIVSLDRVPEENTYYDPPCPDWALVEEHSYQPKNPKSLGHNSTLRLRSDVCKWLNDNVKDRKVPSYIKGGVKGWAVGSDEYCSVNRISFSLFFQRQTDAIAFIKRWSVYKKPISYYNYFRDIKKELNPKTGRRKRT